MRARHVIKLLFTSELRTLKVRLHMLASRDQFLLARRIVLSDRFLFSFWRSFLFLSRPDIILSAKRKMKWRLSSQPSRLNWNLEFGKRHKKLINGCGAPRCPTVIETLPLAYRIFMPRAGAAEYL